MRLALLVICVLALAVPAGWSVTRPSGSLSIEDGRGAVMLKGRGIVIGRLEKGTVEIVDLTPVDQWSPRVNGVPRGRTFGIRSRDVNFYIPGGRYRITVEGEGFSISARGQGTATLDGAPDPVGTTGTFSVGDSQTAPLPVTPEQVVFGTPTSAPAKATP